MIHITKVGREQVATIRSLAHHIWQTAYQHILDPGQMSYMLQSIYSPESLENQITAQGHQFVLVYADDTPAGFASYSQKKDATPGIFRLHKIYLDPLLQGKGVGKMLLDFILKEISPLGATDLELNVNRHNKARHFYEKVGFIIVREEDIDIGNGFYMNDYVINLHLETPPV
jgi:GNAT superfamily N-acetyltransferase